MPVESVVPPGLLIPEHDLAANLRHVETITGPPALTSHVECAPEERAAAGIPEGLIRYSSGIEDASDLIQDLSATLDPL